MKKQKKQHHSKVNTPLHIQELAHSQKKATRFALKAFVWILVIAFIASIGATWDGSGSSFGKIVSTKYSDLDLSPGGFFLRERDAIQRQLNEQNSNADPRLLNEKINTDTLRRSEALALRNNFLKEININPAPSTVKQLQNNIGGNTDIARYYYGLQMLLGDMGLFSILSEPGVSDLYAFNDMTRLLIAAQGLKFSITNFFASKLSEEDKEAFYTSNAEKWADRVVAASFVTDSRSNALELIKTLKNIENIESGLQTAQQLIDSKGRWANSFIKPPNIIQPQADNFELFKAGVNAFKAKTVAGDYGLSAPIYRNGEYLVLLVTSLGSFNALNVLIKEMMLNDMVQNSYNELHKQYAGEWTSSVAQLKKNVASGVEFAEISKNIPGVTLDASEPFSPVSPYVAGIQGAEFVAPVLKDSRLLATLLSDKKPELTASKDDKDTYYAVKAIDIQKPTGDSPLNLQIAMQNPQLLQNIFKYRMGLLDQSLSFGLKKRYNLKSNKELLTNFTL